MTPDTDTAPIDDARLTEWVHACVGRAPRALEPIAPGLGHRTFHRVHFDPPLPVGPRSLVLRVDPPDARIAVGGVAPEPELEPIRACLEAAGVPVPRSFGSDADRGLDLLEDVGDETLEVVAATAPPEIRKSLYRRAIEVVGRLQTIEAPAANDARPAAFERRLDRALIATKARKVVDWLLPEALGRAASTGEREVIETSFDAIADLVEAAPPRLAHRDYKAANLHVMPPQRLVLIDLQGAFMAPPEYDLVCLLRDNHVALDDAEIEAQLAFALTVLPAAPDTDTAGLRFDALTISRVGKDLAHYLDAARSRGDERYLRFVATGLARMQTAAERLRARDARWHALADLITQLTLPPRCRTHAKEAPTCAP